MTARSATAASVQSADPSPWALDPSRQRVERMDAALRSRLTRSLAYLAGFVPAENRGVRARLSEVQSRLDAGPVSPWVFCLYSKLVAQLSRDPRADVAALADDMAR